MTGIVLVHGAWHDPWCWELVASRLTSLGHTVVAPMLYRGSLEADTAAVQAEVDALADRGPVVACGHSYGGAVVTGLRPDGLSHVVCIAGFLLDEGESIFTAGTVEAPATDLGAALVRGDDGLTRIDPVLAFDAFYADCPPALAAAAISRLRPMSMSAMGGSPTRQVWREVPTTYAVCSDDRIVHPVLQRDLARRAGASEEWPTGHSPFLSRPDLVVNLLHGLAG